MKKPQQKTIFYIISIILFFAFFEVVSYFSVSKIIQEGKMLHFPHTSISYEEYLDFRDTLLGWPNPSVFGNNKMSWDSSGSRYIPAFPDHTLPATISLYGDSYTFSADVVGEKAWGNLLAEKIGSRVANYGVYAYGTDQSYLRFKNNKQDTAKIVILGHQSTNTLRNVTQNYSFIGKNTFPGLKPRFSLSDDNELILTPPLKLINENEYNTFVKDPQKILTNDYFRPSGPYWNFRPGFPYTLTAFRVFTNQRFKSGILKRASWLPFYEENHITQSLQITSSILQSFYQEAKEAGRTPIIVLFPMEEDIKNFQKNKYWYYQSLIDDLASNGIEVLNIGEKLVASLEKYDVDVTRIYNEKYHFNELGNSQVAAIIQEYLIAQNLIPDDSFTMKD